MTTEKRYLAPPWTLVPRDPDQRRIVITDRYDEIRSVPLFGGCLGVYLPRGKPGTVEHGIAQLIIAAPELLALVRNVVFLEHSDVSKSAAGKLIINLARTAIAKAEGGLI